MRQLVDMEDPDPALPPNYVPGEVGQRMPGGVYNLADAYPGHSPDGYFAPIGRWAKTNNFSSFFNGAFGTGEDWLHDRVGKAADTLPYRLTEVGLDTGFSVASALYFDQSSKYGLAAQYSLDPKLGSQPGPNSIMQQRLPMDAARLARVSGNVDSDLAQNYDANLWVTRSNYHDAIGLLANRFAQATHTKGLSLITTALSADTYLAAFSVGQYLSWGKTDSRLPIWSVGGLKLSYPSFDYYNTANGPYVQGRIFLNPRGTMVPMLTVGSLLEHPGARVDLGLLRIPVIANRLFVTPQVAVDFQKGGTGILAGASAELRVIGQLGITAEANWEKKDILENDVRNESGGDPLQPKGALETSLSLRYGF